MNASDSSAALLAETATRDLLRHFPLAIASFDKAGRLLALNERFARDYGPEVLDSPPLRTLVAEAVPGWHPVELTGRAHVASGVRAQVLQIQGQSMLILDDTGDPGLLREVQQLHVLITQLERSVATDRLTGIWNRAHLDSVVATEIDRSLRTRQPVSLVLIDIDHFKQVNDTFGHLAGDSLLRELVQVISGTIRSVDMLFRWGGEEFVVLAYSTGYRGAAALAEKIRSEVEQHRFAAVGSLTISLGVAEYFAAEDAKIWFGRVDTALYQAKTTGRNRISVDRRGSSDTWAAQTGLSVTRLVWQEAYECGEPTIDREHRELFDLANTLLAASFESEASPDAFKSALAALYDHLVRHFADEEALLARHQYEGLEAHRQAHAALLARTRELKAAAEAGKISLGELVDFLANNIVAQHLFKMDRQFFPLFAHIPLDGPAPEQQPRVATSGVPTPGKSAGP